MEVLVDYNRWQKIVDIPKSAVKAGVFELAISPPLSETADAGRSVDLQAHKIRVYATGKTDRRGLLIFSNR
jgi:hypothetical protein